jgi:ligand-binding sensor domain-containing protein
MRIRITLYFLFCLGSILNAQQPAYFVLGENHFKGVQIYDVIQDKQLNYWFATNEGLYIFDFYTYKKIECDEAKSNSFFNFVIDSNGTIYCHNLNNQVFKIVNKRCSIFYELKDNEGKADISLAIADDNKLLVGAKKVIVLNQDGTVALKYDITKYLGPAFTNNKKEVQFHQYEKKSILSYSKGKFVIHPLDMNPYTLEPNSVLKFFEIGNKCYAIDLRTKAQFSYNPQNFQLTTLEKNPVFERSGSVRIYETGNEIWAAGTLPGVSLLNGNNLNTNTSVFYTDYFISDIFKDNEGNYLISTFDKGIIVVSDLKVPDVINSFKNDPIVSLYSDKKLGLILGSSKGSLLNYQNNEIQEINIDGKRPIEGIYGSQESSLLVFDNGHIRAYNKQNGKFIDIVEASLKDAVFVSPKEFYLGTNSGIIQCTWDGNSTISTTWLKQAKYRIYALEYNTIDSTIYAATSNGLFYINQNSCKPIIYKSKPIFPNSLFFSKGQLYATDKKNNVLLIENDSVIKTISPTVTGKTELLTQIYIYQNSLIGKSAEGLFQFDLEGKSLKTIHSVFGFATKRVMDYTIHNNQLWVSHAGGVQQINLNYNNYQFRKPSIRFENIIVNDQLIPLKEKNKFNSNQRKIEVVVSVPTLRNRESLRYHYKLIGYENNWNINNHENNKITYNALAPGAYTLIVKLENQGTFSNTIEYSFSIDQPFYAKWWFIASCILLFLAIVILIYRWQLNIQRKKSEQINELNASKLTAIQSQMNPHFIFNSLNSIQDLVLKGDVENSYSYITTFSNLVRRTLNYSEKDFIDFDQELKLLELYLSLEKLRFKKDFNYSIETNDINDIMLPPLLVQPFIENSLVHGLLHKEGAKNLKITFVLKDVLICTIEDNGVGREKAKAIKQRQRSEHESFSGKAIHKRFEILSNVFDGKFGYDYEDLYENDIGIGTKVVLRIPIKHKF